MKKILAAAAVGAGVALVAAAPAYATGDGTATCPAWVLHSITGTEWQDAAAGSEVVDAHTAVLAKPAGGGTELATADTGLELKDAGDITVAYELSGEADFAAGAVRLFYYDHAGADTLTEAPTAKAVADAKSGTLTISGVTGHVGTLGLVYDASNGAGGTVTFSDLKVGDLVVAFDAKACEPSGPPPTTAPPTEPAPTCHPAYTGACIPPDVEDVDCADIGVQVTLPDPANDPFGLDADHDGVGCETNPAGGGNPPAQAGGSGGGGGGGASLPVTGASITTAVGIAAGLLAVGTALFFVVRRRRVRFTAPQ